MLLKLSFSKVVRKGGYFVFLFIAFIFKVRVVVREKNRRMWVLTRSEREGCSLRFCFILPLISVTLDKLKFTSLCSL